MQLKIYHITQTHKRRNIQKTQTNKQAHNYKQEHKETNKNTQTKKQAHKHTNTNKHTKSAGLLKTYEETIALVKSEEGFQIIKNKMSQRKAEPKVN